MEQWNSRTVETAPLSNKGLDDRPPGTEAETQEYGNNIAWDVRYLRFEEYLQEKHLLKSSNRAPKKREKKCCWTKSIWCLIIKKLNEDLFMDEIFY